MDETLFEDLKPQELIVMRHLSELFSKSAGAIINIVDDMFVYKAICLFLRTFCNPIQDKVIIFCDKSNILKWCYYIKKYSGYDYQINQQNLEGVSVFDYDQKKLVDANQDYFVSIADSMHKYSNKRIVKGNFNIALVQGKVTNHKIKHNILKWIKYGILPKWKDFIEYDNNFYEHLIEPYQDVWLYLSWCYPGLEYEDLSKINEKVKAWAAEVGLVVPIIEKRSKPTIPEEFTFELTPSDNISIPKEIEKEMVKNPFMEARSSPKKTFKKPSTNIVRVRNITEISCEFQIETEKFDLNKAYLDKLSKRNQQNVITDQALVEEFSNDFHELPLAEFEKSFEMEPSTSAETERIELKRKLSPEPSTSTFFDDLLKPISGTQSTIFESISSKCETLTESLHFSNFTPVAVSTQQIYSELFDEEENEKLRNVAVIDELFSSPNKKKKCVSTQEMYAMLFE